MKCEDCLTVIEEYFDGELSEHAAVDVKVHLATCLSCSRQFESLRDEQNLYALYRRDLEVTPALWAGIREKIHEDRPAGRSLRLKVWLSQLFGAPRLSPALSFALVVLAVGATAGVMKYAQSRDETANRQTISKINRSPAPSAPASSPELNTTNAAASDAGQSPGEMVEGDTEPPSITKERTDSKLANILTDKSLARREPAKTADLTYEETPERLVREAEQKYQAAIWLLTRDSRRRSSLLESDVRARFEQTLMDVDRTITETRRAVRREPLDPVAVQFMLAAYAKKVEVLREMANYRADEREIQ